MIASSRFQSSVAAVPFLRSIARKDGEKLYDIVAGFVYSQTLLALVELDIICELFRNNLTAKEIASKCDIEPKKAKILCQSGVAIQLLVRIETDEAGNPSYGLSRLGAAVVGVPGLQEMIKHHRLFYEDLSDPVGLLKSQVSTNMSKYWPYVLGKIEASEIKHSAAVMYSRLMETSQQLVAEETLRIINFSGVECLLDVGGGTGAFLLHVNKKYPHINYCLFDLPPVIEQAKKEFSFRKEKIKINFFAGSFIKDSLPGDMDTISLIRVLYDHNDELVGAILRKVFFSLIPGGKIIISEPMSGGSSPQRAGDAYFGFYTMAMSTGKPRDLETHAKLLSEAGFKKIKKHTGSRPFITSVITGIKPK